MAGCWRLLAGKKERRVPALNPFRKIDSVMLIRAVIPAEQLNSNNGARVP